MYPAFHSVFKTSFKDRFGIAVLGCGYWGPNLLRNFHENRDCRLIGVADLNEKRLQWAKSQYPHITTTSMVSELIEHPEVDAVAIATCVGAQPARPAIRCVLTCPIGQVIGRAVRGVHGVRSVLRPNECRIHPTTARKRRGVSQLRSGMR